MKKAKGYNRPKGSVFDQKCEQLRERAEQLNVPMWALDTEEFRKMFEKVR